MRNSCHSYQVTVPIKERFKVLASIYRREDLNYTLEKISKLQGPRNTSREIVRVLSLKKGCHSAWLVCVHLHGRSGCARGHFPPLSLCSESLFVPGFAGQACGRSWIA